MFKDGAFRIPAVPLVLALAGILPFVGTAYVIATTEDVILAAQARLWLAIYAAVILSFLGGVRWGLAMTADSVPAFRLGLSVLGALAGWGFVLLGFSKTFSPILFAGVAALFVLHWAWDVFAGEPAPAWYQGVRTLATLGAVTSLLAAAYL